ncbi:MAG: thioredoxin domain-containing protein [Chloroflexota bacterium]
MNHQEINIKNPYASGSLYVISILLVVLLVSACTEIAPLDVGSSSSDLSADEPAPGGTSADEASTGSDTPEETESEEYEIVGEYQGMPVGVMADGTIFRGEPDAPVTIYEYSDYECPFCLRHFTQTEPSLNEAYIQSGQARIVFMDFPLVQIHPNAPAASSAAICTGEQNPIAYWEMHALIFETQNEWGSLADPIPFFEELSTQLDIDSEVFSDCMVSGRPDAIIEKSYAMGRSLGFGGTPSFQFVNESSGATYDLVGAQPFQKFAEWIDAIARGESPDGAESPPPDEAEIPFWATEEGLAADPDRPGYTVAGDAYRGSLDAPVVIVEYSDYQCPFCRRHTTDTQPILDEQFVDSGQIRWVFKHFPLNIHPQAPMAGVAAECAALQGQFWEMHELLFAYTSNWSIREPNPIFVEMAVELGLDTDAFEVCLADESMMELIESDFAEGRPFVQGTPTFIVLSGGQGRIIPGALPAEAFTQALQEVVDSAP